MTVEVRHLATHTLSPMNETHILNTLQTQAGSQRKDMAKPKHAHDAHRTSRAMPSLPLPQPKLPLGMLIHILRSVDSPSTLISASCVCRTFQDEAERLLYRDITLKPPSLPAPCPEEDTATRAIHPYSQSL